MAILSCGLFLIFFENLSVNRMMKGKALISACIAITRQNDDLFFPIWKTGADIVLNGCMSRLMDASLRRGVGLATEMR